MTFSRGFVSLIFDYLLKWRASHIDRRVNMTPKDESQTYDR